MEQITCIKFEIYIQLECCLYNVICIKLSMFICRTVCKHGKAGTTRYYKVNHHTFYFKILSYLCEKMIDKYECQQFFLLVVMYCSYERFIFNIWSLSKGHFSNLTGLNVSIDFYVWIYCEHVTIKLEKHLWFLRQSNMI